MVEWRDGKIPMHAAVRVEEIAGQVKNIRGLGERYNPTICVARDAKGQRKIIAKLFLGLCTSKRQLTSLDILIEALRNLDHWARTQKIGLVAIPFLGRNHRYRDTEIHYAFSETLDKSPVRYICFMGE